jgi:hypothetical protein
MSDIPIMTLVLLCKLVIVHLNLIMLGHIGQLRGRLILVRLIDALANMRITDPRYDSTGWLNGYRT